MLASVFLENLYQLSHQDLSQIKGFGPVLAKNLLEFTNSDRFQKLLLKFREQEASQINIDIKTDKNKIGSGPLFYQNICITGTFEQSREDLKTYFKGLGADITDSVTKKTTILLVGADPGGKLAKAKQLEIMVFESVAELQTKFDIPN